MKNTILIIALVFGSFTAATAQSLDAKPLEALIKQIESSRFTYRENGMVFGFHSIKSCLYTSNELIVLKNYCVPKKNYPAKGYTIFSPKFGMIDLYQEQLPNVLKRDVRISEFSSVLFPVLNQPLPSYRISKLNSIFEYLYPQRNPSCWSTNFSRYTEAPEVACNVNPADIFGYDAWAAETQTITASQADWARLIRKLESVFKK